MKVYLSGRYGRKAELRAVAERLLAAGHPVTSRWLFAPDEAVADEAMTRERQW